MTDVIVTQEDEDLASLIAVIDQLEPEDRRGWLLKKLAQHRIKAALAMQERAAAYFDALPATARAFTNADIASAIRNLEVPE